MQGMQKFNHIQIQYLNNKIKIILYTFHCFHIYKFFYLGYGI